MFSKHRDFYFDDNRANGRQLFDDNRDFIYTLPCMMLLFSTKWVVK